MGFDFRKKFLEDCNKFSVSEAHSVLILPKLLSGV